MFVNYDTGYRYEQYHPTYLYYLMISHAHYDVFVWKIGCGTEEKEREREK